LSLKERNNYSPEIGLWLIKRKSLFIDDFPILYHLFDVLLKLLFLLHAKKKTSRKRKQ
jgi:hypothetical protein